MLEVLPLIVFVLLCTIISMVNAFVPAATQVVTVKMAPKFNYKLRTSMRLNMVSVGGGGGGVSGGETPKKTRVLIAPDTNSDEQMIIENFGQIQQGERKRIGIIGTQDLSDQHYQMIELLTYALVLSGNHIFTSGSAGNIENSLRTTNTAVIYGALRACSSELLTVILPQSLPRQPPEMQSILMRVANLIEHPECDDMDFKDAVAACNDNVMGCVDKLLIFAYHDSKYVLQCAEKVEGQMEVTKFFLD
jgi:hypothetical protein